MLPAKAKNPKNSHSPSGNEVKRILRPISYRRRKLHDKAIKLGGRFLMRKAHYDLLEGGEGYIGKIPKLQGVVWANADSLEACRDELREVLEEWIILGLKMNHHIPVIDGIELNFEKVA